MKFSAAALCLLALCACAPRAFADDTQSEGLPASRRTAIHPRLAITHLLRPPAAYASLAPPKYVLQLSYPGEAVTDPPPCNATAPGSACLPVLDAGVGQSVTITYSVNSSYVANTSSTVTLKGCFSATSSANRAWRKANPIIAKDKQCSVKIATGLPAAGGNFTFKLGPNMAPAVYRVLALEVCTGGAFCAMGSSPGYFQVLAIDSRPKWLIVMASCFAAIGPVSLAAFFVWEQKIKKQQ